MDKQNIPIGGSGADSRRVLDALTPLTGTGAPTVNAEYLGQTYIDDNDGFEIIYTSINVGSENPIDDWEIVNPNHDGDYAPLNHNHDSLYSSTNHDHNNTYSLTNHNHDLMYAPLNHTHDSLNSDIITLINKTGGLSVKGTVVCPSATVDLSVDKIAVNVPDPIGVIAEDGIADGQPVKVVKSGIADVLFIGNTTRKNIARGFITGDAGYIAGHALSEAVPSSPFATDKHFYEIGHVLESRVGAGLAKVMLHFN